MEIKLPNTLPNGCRLLVLDDQAKINRALDIFGWNDLNNQSVTEFREHVKKLPVGQPAVWFCGLFNETHEPPALAGLGLGYAAGVWYRRLLIIDYPPAARKKLENVLPSFTCAYLEKLLEGIHQTPGMFGPLLDETSYQ